MNQSHTRKSAHVQVARTSSSARRRQRTEKSATHVGGRNMDISWKTTKRDFILLAIGALIGIVISTIVWHFRIGF